MGKQVLYGAKLALLGVTWVGLTIVPTYLYGSKFVPKILSIMAEDLDI